MPPAGLIRKVIEYEISEADKSRKRTKSKKTKSSSSARKRTTNTKRKKKRLPNRKKAASKALSVRSEKKTTKCTTVAKNTDGMAPSKSAAVGANSTQVRMFDDYHITIEISPSSKAKCRCCGQIIQKRQERVLATKGRSRTQFYHLSCLHNKMGNPLFAGLWDATSRQQLRVESRQRWAAAITDNSRRKDAHSSPEIIVIDDSDDEEAKNSNSLDSAAIVANTSTRNQSDYDGGDYEILFEETLSCAQVVQQKFDRAAANGEIVSIG